MTPTEFKENIMETKKPETKSGPRKLKLISINCHQGVTLAPNGAGMVMNGIKAAQHGIEMELHPAGVILSYNDPKTKGKGKLIPYTNITQCDVEFEE